MDIKPLLVAERLSARLLIVQCGQLTFVCTYIYVCMCIYIYIWSAHVCMYIYICMYVCVYIYIYIDR